MTFDHVLRQSPIGIALLSANGTHEAVNAAYCAVYGCDEADLLDKPFSLAPQLANPATHDSGTRHGAQILQRQDGSLAHISFEMASVWGVDGVHRRLVYVTDITKLVQTQNKLRQAVVNSQALLKNHASWHVPSPGKLKMTATQRHDAPHVST